MQGTSTKFQRPTIESKNADIGIWNDAKTLQKLRGIVTRIEHDIHRRLDLFQEAWLRLWTLAKEQPGQTESWYLQNCKFHLQHLAAHSRRARSRERLLETSNTDLNSSPPEELVQPVVDGFDVVHLRDLIERMKRMLDPTNRRILEMIVEEHGVREIVRVMRLSSRDVVAARRKIRALMLKLMSGDS